MSIREIVTDANGKRIQKEVPGYEDKPKANAPKKGFFGGKKKATEAKAKVSKAEPKAKVKTEKAPKVKATKAPFKAVVMGLNGKNAYVPQSKVEYETGADMDKAYKAWRANGAKGEFIAIAR